MATFDDIYEIAADNYGLVTAAEAAGAGAATSEVARWVRQGRLVRVWRGVYRLAHYIPTPYDGYAEAVAIVGPGAYLFGESVIALHGLAPTNPKVTHVATPRRVRRELPDSIAVTPAPPGGAVTAYEGIPSQGVFDSILACRGRLMRERLVQAADAALGRGLITREQRDALEKGIS